MAYRPPISYSKKFTEKWTSVQPGDVVKAPSGALRVIREVSLCEDSRMSSLRKVHVSFVIGRCSWTHRPYTVYSVGELICLGYTLTGVRDNLRTKFDKEFEKDLAACKADSTRPSDFKCCEVIGIA